MNYDNYVAKVENRFSGNRVIELDSLEVHHCYDDFGDGITGKFMKDVFHTDKEQERT